MQRVSLKFKHVVLRRVCMETLLSLIYFLAQMLPLHPHLCSLRTQNEALFILINLIVQLLMLLDCLCQLAANIVHDTQQSSEECFLFSAFVLVTKAIKVS